MCDWVAVSRLVGQDILGRISREEAVTVHKLKEAKTPFQRVTARQAQQALSEDLIVFETTMGGHLIKCDLEELARAVARSPEVPDRPKRHYDKRRPVASGTLSYIRRQTALAALGTS